MRIGVALAFFAGTCGCGCLQKEEGLSTMKAEAGKRRALATVLAACESSARGSVCGRMLEGDCEVVIKVDGNRYRCPR
jgi:hypothetical protein